MKTLSQIEKELNQIYKQIGVVNSEHDRLLYKQESDLLKERDARISELERLYANQNTVWADGLRSKLTSMFLGEVMNDHTKNKIEYTIYHYFQERFQVGEIFTREDAEDIANIFKCSITFNQESEV